MRRQTIRHRFGQFGRYRGLMVLVLWQAPIPIQRDSTTGNMRLTFATGAGSYEIDRFDCNGDLVDSRTGMHIEGGTMLEMQPSANTKLSVYTGILHDDGIGLPVTYNDAGTGVGNYFDGRETGNHAYGGGMLSFEGRRVGVGAGAAFQHYTYPTMYFRFGNLDKTHFLMDFATPDPALPAVGMLHIGIGHHNGWARGGGATAGMVFCYYCENDGAGAFLKLHYPVSPDVDVTGSLLGVSGHESAHGAMSVGARIRLNH